ncbi:MAG: TonB-dependent receptor [Cyanobacteria bacterium P01_F01_bin.3]
MSVSKSLSLVLSLLTWILLLPQEAVLSQSNRAIASSNHTNGSHTEQLAQAATITDVQIGQTETGLALTLVSEQALSVGDIRTVGDAVLIDLFGVSLALSDPDTAQQFAPVEGIALVQVSSVADGGVQVSITGSDGPPTVDVVSSDVASSTGGLALAVVPGMATADADVDAIRVVVTATRTEEELLDIPRSVTVIDREEIQQQRQLTNNLPDILGQLVPGLGPPTLQNSTRNLSLRGRTALILIDGVPQNPNSGFNSELNTIDPDVIERIEVVRGPSAVYGDGATGGIINIITRAATDEAVAYEFGVNTSLGLTSIQEDSFGYGATFGVAGSDERADLQATLSYDTTNSFFDANGDRIPPNRVADADRLGFLTKLGYNLTEQQRLGFLFSYYREDLDNTNFISDASILQIPGLQTARAIEIAGVDYERDPEQTSYTLNLNYGHEDLLGSQFDAQFYYRYTELAQRFSDIRGRGRPAFNPQLFQTSLDSLEWGGRAQFDTKFDDNFSLLWGADYGQEENARPVLVLDAATFDATGNLNITEIANQTPRYDLETLGLFAQATWDISNQWQLSGGLRYDEFDVSVEETVLAFRRNIDDVRRAGDVSASDVSFNAGLIYKPVPEIGLFASFAQGFSIPDIGLVAGTRLPATVNIGTDVELAPQQVNNFEVGVRAEFEEVQATLSGFYNESSLGTNLQVGADGFTDVVRAPQRNYGLEATLDWQPTDVWQLGGYFSWNEGENDTNNDGEFLPLSGLQVQPYKVGLYLDNQTAPGWTNRLQLLGVGGRDRAFDEGVDAFDIEGYVTLDLLSSIAIGDGTLTLGIQNLLNNQYLPLSSQERVRGTEDRRFAAPGINLNVGYSIEF